MAGFNGIYCSTNKSLLKGDDGILQDQTVLARILILLQMFTAAQSLYSTQLQQSNNKSFDNNGWLTFYGVSWYLDRKVSLLLLADQFPS